MDEARELITVFHELNKTGKGIEDRRVAQFSASLVGMIGSTAMFDALLTQFDAALASGKITAELKDRAKNLQRTFVPQVAGYNGIKDISSIAVTVDDLRNVHADSVANRIAGVVVILAALMKILQAVNSIR
jgi:hypothetical protein